MKYPLAKNWLSYHRTSKAEYDVVDNLDGSVYKMRYTVAKFAKSLDGRTNPYQIDQSLSREDIKSILSNLRKHGLLRENRVLQSSFGTFLYTVWIPEWTMLLRIFSFVMNSLLLLLWLPTLLWGIHTFVNSMMIINIEFSLTGYLLGLIFGICLHELAHAFAGISYRAKVFEVGIGFQSFMLCAYTLMESSHCKRIQRIQINSAGVESNFLLTGAFLILCAPFPHCGASFFSAALCNLSLGVINLLSLDGLDGMAILSDIIGIDAGNFLKNAKRVVHSRDRRKTLQKEGFSGYALIVISYIMVISQIGFLLLMLINIRVVITCFV